MQHGSLFRHSHTNIFRVISRQVEYDITVNVNQFNVLWYFLMLKKNFEYCVVHGIFFAADNLYIADKYCATETIKCTKTSWSSSCPLNYLALIFSKSYPIIHVLNVRLCSLCGDRITWERRATKATITLSARRCSFSTASVAARPAVWVCSACTSPRSTSLSSTRLWKRWRNTARVPVMRTRSGSSVSLTPVRKLRLLH